MRQELPEHLYESHSTDHNECTLDKQNSAGSHVQIAVESLQCQCAECGTRSSMIPGERVLQSARDQVQVKGA